MKYTLLIATLIVSTPAQAQDLSLPNIMEEESMMQPVDAQPQTPIISLGKSFSDLVNEGWKPNGAVIAMAYIMMEKDRKYAVCTLQITDGWGLYPPAETTSIDSACYQITD